MVLTEIGRLKCTSHRKKPRPNVLEISKVGIDLINPRYMPATCESADSAVGLDIIKFNSASFEFSRHLKESDF